MNEALLAEDEPVSRAFLLEALQALGWRCEAVADGANALARALARRYDLLVLDLNLPGLDGASVLARLREGDQAASHCTAALALTADHDPALHERLREAGFVAVATKPITLDALARAIDLACGTSACAVWDEAAALRASGGQAAVVAALRALMRRDLPAQRRAIASAWQDGDLGAARAELHRLRAACGFCGAAGLAEALDALHRADTPAHRQATLVAIDALLAS